MASSGSALRIKRKSGFVPLFVYPFYLFYIGILRMRPSDQLIFYFLFLEFADFRRATCFSRD